MAENIDTNITINKEAEISTATYIFAIFYVIIFIIWAFAGFIGFIMSIVCLSYQATDGEKIAGLLLGMFTGPFFWLYYIFSKTYCTKNYYYPQ
jgi:hypothetical protein